MAVKKEKESNTIAIVGGGAAGLFAAYFAKITAPDHGVILIEKNTYLGAKVLISGGGRCNVTTGLKDVREILKNYPRGDKFLRAAMENFPPEAVMTWFETQGVALKTEADRRVFPVSNNGQDIVGALTAALQENGVKIMLKTSVTSVDVLPSGRFIIMLDQGGQNLQLPVSKLILTTGGSAYRHTGSTGDGYAFASQMGHTITPLAPALTSLKTEETWSHDLAGLSFPEVKLSLQIQPGTFSNKADTDNKKPSTPRPFERLGACLFTHQGLSGPAVFALSSLAAFAPISKDKPARLTINFFPNLKADLLLSRLNELIAANPKKQLLNLLDILLPHSLAQTLPNVLHTVNPHKQATHLSKVERQNIAFLLQNIVLTVTGRGLGDEMVTAGGVDLLEVDSSTMQSKTRPGLFFAGELLDIDGFTGGFNLQASWATGALAGQSAAENISA